MSADAPTVLQTGPEDFEVWAGGGRRRVRLAHRTRRGLGLAGVPPVEVVREMIRFLVERDDLGDADPLDLGPAVGRHAEAVEELRARLG